MGVTLPVGLLCAVAGMMLAFMPLRASLLGSALLLLFAIIAAQIRLGSPSTDALLGGCWASLVACALCVFWRHRPRVTLVSMLAANAGLWSGLTLATADAGPNAVFPITALLTVLPAWWAVRKGYGIAPRVVTSWLLAVAMIAAVLPHVVTHPGYVPDHME